MQVHKQPNKSFILLLLSRIHPKKRIELLLESISKVSDNVRLWITGTGEEAYIYELKEKAKAWAIEDKIEWLGWKNRTEKFKGMKRQTPLYLLPIKKTLLMW